MSNQHPVVAVEVTYPFHMGGDMMEGYMCNDQQMAQAVVNAAIESARHLERERIIKLLENDMALAIGIDGKCRYEEHYAEACHCDIIALIKGENK